MLAPNGRSSSAPAIIVVGSGIAEDLAGTSVGKTFAGITSDFSPPAALLCSTHAEHGSSNEEMKRLEVYSGRQDGDAERQKPDRAHDLDR